MIDRKIPASQRARWPVVATADQAVWIAGHLLDERFAVAGQSAQLVMLRCFREEMTT